MELKEIDYSRITLLTRIRRKEGALYLPTAGAALLNRYKFVKFPDQTQLLSDTIKFEHGLFENTAIAEFTLFEHGIQVVARSNTDILDRFTADLLTWAQSELGLWENGVPPREHHYESALVVAMQLDEKKVLPWAESVLGPMRDKLVGYGLPSYQFSVFGASIAIDPTKYAGWKPSYFSVGRRVNVPFEAGIYYSTAPLKTADHLSLLTFLEERLA